MDKKYSSARDPLTVLRNFVIQTRYICVALFGLEFLIIFCEVILLTKCYQYNSFYVLGFPPQFGRVVTSIFCMLVCMTGGKSACKWILRTCVTNIFGAIFSLIVMSLYRNKNETTIAKQPPFQYYSMMVVYWCTVTFLFYDIFCLMMISSLDNALCDKDKMENLEKLKGK